VPLDPDAITAATLAELLATHPASAALTAGLRAEELVKMREKGVAHAHFRLAGRGLVLRVPRLSQWALPPEENLAYQAACFRRAEPSGATPRLAAVLPVGDALPRGALLVEEISGRPPRLPQELPSIATALARIHALPVPEPARRAPLADHGVVGPIAGTLAVIERQVPALDEADLPHATRDALLAELDGARDLAATASVQDQPITLVGTDTHPGNFIIRDDGSAALVDLEKALYGSPAIDLAHASLFTSTTWDLDVQATLSRADIAAFYHHYLEQIGPDAEARLRPWLLPCRRLTWLRTMMWCVRWRVASAANPDWSERRVDPILVAHIRRRVAMFFAPETVASVRAEWLEAPLLAL
jgi:aminoglycoside phosphotransferase (APT) family kinase protein